MFSGLININTPIYQTNPLEVVSSVILLSDLNMKCTEEKLNFTVNVYAVLLQPFSTFTAALCRLDRDACEDASGTSASL